MGRRPFQAGSLTKEPASAVERWLRLKKIFANGAYDGDLVDLSRCSDEFFCIICFGMLFQTTMVKHFGAIWLEIGFNN